MSETQKRSIELIDAIESILHHKSYPLSLEYLSLKLRKKYTMKTVNKPAFINMVQCEISKYPHRITQQEDGMFILANSQPPTPTSQLDIAVTHATTYDLERRNSPCQPPGCEEELEVHRLTQEVQLLRELTTGCLAWNHSLAGMITEKRRELEEINTDTNLLLASYHSMKENGNKVRVKFQKKKYNKKSSKEGRDSKHKRKIIVAKGPKRNLSLKTISVKKSKIKMSTKYRKTLPQRSELSPPAPSSPIYPSSPLSKSDFQSSEDGSGNLQNSNQSEDSCSAFSEPNNSPCGKQAMHDNPSSADSD